MRLSTRIILLLIIGHPIHCLGQELTYTDSSLIHNAKLIILSEWHLSDLMPQYKGKLIEKLYKEEDLTDVVLETGKSTAYLLNEYVAPPLFPTGLNLTNSALLLSLNSIGVQFPKLECG